MSASSACSNSPSLSGPRSRRRGASRSRHRCRLRQRPPLRRQSRRLLAKNREIGLFCNVSASTLTDGSVFPQLLDFLEENRTIAPSVVFEFPQSVITAAGPIEFESLAALAERGYRFSLDNVTDLR